MRVKFPSGTGFLPRLWTPPESNLRSGTVSDAFSPREGRSVLGIVKSTIPRVTALSGARMAPTFLFTIPASLAMATAPCRRVTASNLRLSRARKAHKQLTLGKLVHNSLSNPNCQNKSPGPRATLFLGPCVLKRALVCSHAHPRRTAQGAPGACKGVFSLDCDLMVAALTYMLSSPE